MPQRPLPETDFETPAEPHLELLPPAGEAEAEAEDAEEREEREEAAHT